MPNFLQGVPVLIFYIVPFDQDISLKRWLIKIRFSNFRDFFLPQSQEWPFLGVGSHIGGENYQPFEVILKQ